MTRMVNKLSKAAILLMGKALDETWEKQLCDDAASKRRASL